MATITMEQLQKKVEAVQKKAPAIVHKSMKKGAQILVREMKKQYVLAGLRKQSGDLYNSIQVLKNNLRGTKIVTAAGVGKIKGHSQVYKARAHELGLTIDTPGGQPFLFIPGEGLRYISKRHPKADKFPKTKPSSFTLPKRAFVAPAKKAKLPAVREQILRDMIEAYRRG